MKKILSLVILLTTFYACSNSPKETEKEVKNEAAQWQKIDPKTISDNVVTLFSDNWALITAGTPEKYNMMTASWGTIGNLWQNPVAMCFVRPQRYTFEFTEREENFTLIFLDETYRDTLEYLGSVSGRDENKMEKSGLTLKILPSGNIAFEEARMIIECKKVYADFFKEENFLDAKIVEKLYPTKDFHRFYVGEITAVWEKK